MKRRRKSKRSDRQKAIGDLDSIFSKYIRRSHADGFGMVACVTCKKRFRWDDTEHLNAGHFMLRQHMATRWEPMNVHPQCVSCNKFNAGEQYDHGKYIDETYGPGSADSLRAASRRSVKWLTAEIEDEIERFTRLLAAIS